MATLTKNTPCLWFDTEGEMGQIDLAEIRRAVNGG